MKRLSIKLKIILHLTAILIFLNWKIKIKINNYEKLNLYVNKENNYIIAIMKFKIENYIFSK